MKTKFISFIATFSLPSRRRVVSSHANIAGQRRPPRYVKIQYNYTFIVLILLLDL